MKNKFNKIIDFVNSGLIPQPVLLVFCYILSNVLILLVHGIFWDDITLYKQSQEGIMHQFYGNGGIYIGWLHLVMQSFKYPILLYHVLIFVIGLINVYVFYKILNNISYLKNLYFAIALLYSVFPWGYTHMTMICFPYQLGYMFQLFAIYLYIINFVNFKWHLVFLYFVCQFIACSFLISNIVLCGSIILLSVLTMQIKEFSWSALFLKDLIIKLLLKSVYFLPCLIFWVIRLTFFMPTGAYAQQGYNSFSLSYFLQYPKNLLISICNSCNALSSALCDIFSNIYFVVIFVCLGVSFYFIINNRRCSKVFFIKKSLVFILIGACFLYVAGITAYLLVGQVQEHNSMLDRHGILLSLSIPIIIVTLIYLLVQSEKKRNVILSVFISLFICESINKYLNAISESQKNDTIIQFFQTNDLPAGNCRVIDYTDTFLCGRFYTWSGLYFYATQKQDKCFVVNDNMMFADSSYLNTAYYQKDAHAEEPKIIIQVTKNNYNSENLILKNIIYYYLKPEKYEMRLPYTYKLTLINTKQ